MILIEKKDLVTALLSHLLKSELELISLDTFWFVSSIITAIIMQNRYFLSILCEYSSEIFFNTSL